MELSLTQSPSLCLYLQSPLLVKYSYNCVIHTERSYFDVGKVTYRHGGICNNYFINKNCVILCSEGDDYVLEDEVVTLDAGSSVGCATIRIVSDDLIEGPEDFNVEITTDDAFAVISNGFALVTITGELGEEEKKEWEMEEKDGEKRNKKQANHCVLLFFCSILYGPNWQKSFPIISSHKLLLLFFYQSTYWKTVLFNVQR